jgi:hypothetical protein
MFEVQAAILPPGMREAKPSGWESLTGHGGKPEAAVSQHILTSHFDAYNLDAAGVALPSVSDWTPA